MFEDQTTSDPMVSLSGYFKLGYSTNQADNLKNFANPTGPSAVKRGTGAITFDETDQAGEQSAFDSRRNGGRDAIVPLSGAFAWNQTALARPTPGIAFDFRFGYSSGNSFGGFKLGGIDPFTTGPLGPGWRHTFGTRVLPAQAFSPLSDTDTIGLMTWDGAIETWDLNFTTGEYETRDQEYRGEFSFLGTTNCQWVTPERIVYRFKRPDSDPPVMRGRLLEIHDFNQNSVKVLWNETSGVITQVVDTAGGQYTFGYVGNLLKTVSFGSWVVHFDYNQTNHLISKSLTGPSNYAPTNTNWQFGYNATNGLLERIIDPRGITNIFVQYDQYGRKTNETDAINRSTRTEYNLPAKRQIRHTDPGGYQWVETYDRKGHQLVQEDPLHNQTSYTYDAQGNRTSMREPLGFTTYFGYDDRANVIARTNALQEVSRWVFHPVFNKAIQEITPQPPDANGWVNWTNFFQIDDATGNLLRHYDALGDLVRYIYSTNGLVQTSVDANGYATRFSYDTNGFLVATTGPENDTTSYLLNEVGWKLAETNALRQVTSYTLDVNGRAIRIQDPLLRVFTNNFDPVGNLLSVSDGKGNFTFHYYDAANQKTQTVDRLGFANRFFYTRRGKLERGTDALGNTTTNFYDLANRVERVSDPLGGTVTNSYDGNGRVYAFTDKAGRRSFKRFDRLNRMLAETDPENNTTTTTYDVAGRVRQITSPNGFSSTHTYDGRGCLATWIDPEGFAWQYQYDGNGNIVNIIDALQGNYTMSYGSRNQRTSERNQDGREWTYIYDPLLRLSVQTDPNHTGRTNAYDNGGRLQSVTFSTGRTNSFQYDLNNNPTNLTRAKGIEQTILRINYDTMDRPIAQTDFATQLQVSYGRDALGQVTNLVYPGNALDPATKPLRRQFDAIERLTNLVDWTNQTMTFQYDKADRLIGRTYPNGLVQSNSFDNAGRITSLNYSSINHQPSTISLALTYAYDRNGNKTNWTETGTLPWTPPAAYDERSGFTGSGRITNRVDALNPARNFSYQFDPSGNMTNCTGGGQSFGLTYDEDNRVMTLNWSNGLTDKSILNRYDVFGRRIERTVNNIKTSYALDLSGSMERILFERDDIGNFNYFVHAPDLCYKLDQNGLLTCFHADAQANIIALTSAGQTNLAQYAYTPYGRMLGSTNFQSQITNPYLFVGSQGIMEEIPGLYFMRARYYSADAGVFLSTDPVKNIGQSWKSIAYAYTHGNPLSMADPTGLAAIQIGGSLGVLAVLIAGGNASASSGIVIETAALAKGDWGNAIGIYGANSEGGEGGYIAGAGPSAQLEFSISKSGYGVKSIKGPGWYAGARGVFGLEASLAITGDEKGGNGISFSFGGRTSAGFAAIGGVSFTGVESLGDVFNGGGSGVGKLTNQSTPATMNRSTIGGVNNDFLNSTGKDFGHQFNFLNAFGYGQAANGLTSTKQQVPTIVSGTTSSQSATGKANGGQGGGGKSTDAFSTIAAQLQIISLELQVIKLQLQVSVFQQAIQNQVPTVPSNSSGVSKP